MAFALPHDSGSTPPARPVPSAPTQQDRDKVRRFLQERGKLHVRSGRRGTARLSGDQATELAVLLGGRYVVHDDSRDEEEDDARFALLNALISEVRMANSDT